MSFFPSVYSDINYIILGPYDKLPSKLGSVGNSFHSCIKISNVMASFPIIY